MTLLAEDFVGIITSFDTCVCNSSVVALVIVFLALIKVNLAFDKVILGYVIVLLG